MAIGDITTAAIATLDYSTNTTSEQCMVHHSGNTYVAVCASTASRYFVIHTLHISDDGATITSVDSWQLPSVTSTVGPTCIKIAPQLFLFYGKTTVGTEAFTVQIDNSGVITKAKYTTSGTLS